jgi:hypothetical protein
MEKFLEGKKTYIGLVIALLGVLGLGDLISEGELTVVVDAVLQIAGIAIAAYGRLVAKPKK